MITKSKQEEDFICNSLFNKSQQLTQIKNCLVEQYQKDEDSMTKSLMAMVFAIIGDGQADQSEIERLQTLFRQAERSYQEELVRLRDEKVDHESALKQEQELLINTLMSHTSEMREATQELQLAMDSSYIDYMEPDLSVSKIQQFAAPAVNAQQPIVGTHQQLSSSHSAVINESSLIHVGEEQKRVGTAPTSDLTLCDSNQKNQMNVNGAVSDASRENHRVLTLQANERQAMSSTQQSTSSSSRQSSPTSDLEADPAVSASLPTSSSLPGPATRSLPDQ